MASLNKVLLIGNLGKDPEVKYLDGGGVVARVTLATTEKYKDKSGNLVENTEWHNLEIWGEQAKVAEQYLKKGKQIYVEGKIKTDSWEDNGVKKYRTNIRVLNFTMLGSSGGGEGSNVNKSNTGAGVDAPSTNADGTDDLPF